MDEFAIEQHIGRAGAAVFRAAYNALAEETGTPGDETDVFVAEAAITGAAAVVTAWPKLMAGPGVMDMQMVPAEPEVELPASTMLSDGWEGVQLGSGGKLWLRRRGDELEVEWIADNAEGKAVRSSGVMVLP